MRAENDRTIKNNKNRKVFLSLQHKRIINFEKSVRTCLLAYKNLVKSQQFFMSVIKPINISYNDRK
jgi:hypothetical protein